MGLAVFRKRLDRGSVLGVLVHVPNPSPQAARTEVKTGRFQWVLGQPGLYSKFHPASATW